MIYRNVPYQQPSFISPDYNGGYDNSSIYGNNVNRNTFTNEWDNENDDGFIVGNNFNSRINKQEQEKPKENEICKTNLYLKYTLYRSGITEIFKEEFSDEVNVADLVDKVLNNIDYKSIINIGDKDCLSNCIVIETTRFKKISDKKEMKIKIDEIFDKLF